VRTLLFLVAGLLLLAAFLLLAKLFSPNYPDATRLTTIAYVALWFIIAGVNMWVGVARAGYSVAEDCQFFFSSSAYPQLWLSCLNGGSCEPVHRAGA
jgi:hypothetical protein